MLFFGINPVNECLRAGLKPDCLLLEDGKQDNPRIAQILRQARHMRILVETHHDLRGICQHDAHQGIAAELPDLDQSLPAHADLGPRVVMLDGLQDPHNFGAALRVCDVFGSHQVIYHKGNSSGLTPVAIKSSAGAAFHLQIYHSNLNHAARQLLDNGYQLLVLDAKGPVSLYDCPVPEKFCLTIGSEDKGVRHVIQRLATSMVHIPMFGHVDSLNVSCALSAALSEFARRGPMPPTS